MFFFHNMAVFFTYQDGLLTKIARWRSLSRVWPILPKRRCRSGLSDQKYSSRWWFQTFFIFTPIWGRCLIWLIFFTWVETIILRWFLKYQRFGFTTLFLWKIPSLKLKVRSHPKRKRLSSNHPVFRCKLTVSFREGPVCLCFFVCWRLTYRSNMF